MRPPLQNIGKISLGLFLLGVLFIGLFQKFSAPDGYVSTAAPLSAGGTASSLVSSRHPESEAVPVEDAWAEELRGLKELVAKDPEAALARVARMPEKHERKTAAKIVCLALASKDPKKAMTAAWRFELGVFADEASESDALEILARQWATADLGKAFIWASALPADDEARRDRVVKGIALALAQIAPAEAARMVSEHIAADSSVRVDATIEVLRHWAAQEYSGAMAWASLFPDGALRERGLDTLANVDPVPPPPANPSK